MDKEETAGSGQGKRGYILTYRESETDIIIMEICKAPTLRLKAHRDTRQAGKQLNTDHIKRQLQTETHTERDRHTQIETHTETDTQRQTHRDRHTLTHIKRHAQKETHTDK